ncbi:MAG: cell division protein ZapE [Magnetococcales bacterium]|nr:cell division protein ZapE [Magnetococcales bacterium]
MIASIFHHARRLSGRIKSAHDSKEGAAAMAVSPLLHQQSQQPLPEPIEATNSKSAPPPAPAINHDHLPSPSKQYKKRRQQKRLKHDSDQEAVLPLLDQFVADLHQPVERVIRQRVEIWQGINGQATTRGLYLFGPVGRGKSMLMQLVFDAVAFEQKRRVHFHPFMEELHQRMHDTEPTPGIDVMYQVASELSNEARLLCFDEFFIDNIQDAMLLGRLLEYLFKCGVILCATSNCGPDGLFKGGFNRKRFLPLLKDLQSNIQELDLSYGADWRRQDSPSAIKHELTPEQLFFQFSANHPHPTSTVLDRMVVLAKGIDKDIYWFDFKTLCDQQLGPAEYMDLCKKARAVLISDIPQMGEDGTDAAMRLIILIDLLYEYDIPLRVFSDLPLEEICTEGPAAFPFKRAVSRIFGLMKRNVQEK